MSAARRVEPLDGPLDAEVTLPGSKSLTNRALVVATLAAGTSTLEGALTADDTEAMVGCLTRLGARVARAGDRWTVAGTGGRLAPGPATLDARLSGTTARFVLPVAAMGPGPYRLDGRAPLRRRPMGPALEALRSLGVAVTEAGVRGHLPVTVSGGPLRGGAVAVPGGVSSQFASGLMLAAPCMPEGLDVSVPGRLVSEPYVAMTAAVMTAFGATVEQPGPGRFAVAPGSYRSRTYVIEPDASAASYFFAAAAVCGGRVRVPGLGTGSLQGDLGFVDVLERMGAVVRRTDEWTEVEGVGPLEGIDVDLAGLSDTAQTLAVVAVFASSPTRVRGIGFIRAKETDRIAHPVAELRRCGIEAEETDDGFVVHPGTPRPATVQTYDDHRMAMSFALLGLRAPGIAIADPGCVDKTFPGFWDTLDSLRSGSGEARQ